MKIECIVCGIDDISNCDCSYRISGTDSEKLYWNYVRIVRKNYESIA